MLSAGPLGAFSRYLVSAGAATIVDAALVQLLLSLTHNAAPGIYAVIIALGALLGISVNFTLSSRFAFTPDNRPTHRQFASFFAVSLTTLLLRLVVAFSLLALFSAPVFNWLDRIPVAALPERLAHLGAIGLVVFYSFFAHKHVSFGGGVLTFLAKKAAVRP